MLEYISSLTASLGPYSNYATLLIIILVFVVIAKLATVIIDRFERHIVIRTKSSIDDILLEAVKRPVMLGIILFGVYLSLGVLPVLALYSAEIQMIFTVIFSLYAAYFASRIVGAIIEWYSKEIAVKTQSKADDQFLPIIKKIAFAVIFGIFILVMMGQLGIQVTTLIAAMGIGGLALALALQPTLSNFFSGMQMVLDRPLKIGDYVEMDSGDKGTVMDIGWRSTRIRTYANNIVTVPNSKVADSKIINYNVPDTEIGFSIDCGVAYDSDLEKTERVAVQVAKDVMKRNEGVEGYEPLFRYKEFGNSSINFKVIMRAKTFGAQFKITHNFIKELKKRFDKNGIEIAFPQLDVHIEKTALTKKRSGR